MVLAPPAAAERERTMPKPKKKQFACVVPIRAVMHRTIYAESREKAIERLLTVEPFLVNLGSADGDTIEGFEVLADALTVEEVKKPKRGAKCQKPKSDLPAQDATETTEMEQLPVPQPLPDGST